MTTTRRLFDDDSPQDERLPRRVAADLIQSMDASGRLQVAMYVENNVVGVPLRDHALIDDGNRYHDVLHLAHMALLGWSPVMRAAFKCKRRSAPLMLEVEDGPRATVAEEAIAALTLGAARAGTIDASVPRNILDSIEDLVQPLEVASVPREEWVDVLVRGVAAWRSLYAAAGGTVWVDVPARRFDWRPRQPTVTPR